ncbi:MAG: GH92 family glycosyl hydrolase [Bacteroidota bacterium]
MSRNYLLCCLVFALSCIASTEKPERRPVDWVDPHIDAANSRWFFFSSACRPFGMVNLSPDNLLGGTWGTGYRYHVDTIRGFSHIHAWQLSGVSVMPSLKSWSPTSEPDAYSETFSHDDEVVKAGYHQLKLDNGIVVELTSTTRVGFHRYRYPEGNTPFVLFNLTGPLGPSIMTNAAVEQTAKDEIAGYTINGATRRRPKEATVYFVAKFDQEIAKFEAWEGQAFLEEGMPAEGKKCGVRLAFAPTNESNPYVQMKVGISYVSIEQARINLQAELEHWDFDRVVEESQKEWNEYLSRIEIEGGTDDQKRRFYTDLWHALQGRRIISDADGKYCDMTGPEKRIGQIPLDAFGEPKYNHYNSDSYWGAQWTLNTLWHLVYPEITEEFCESMLMMYRDGGLIPRGPSGGNYTYVMTGASSTPFFVSAYQKGIRGEIDWEEAYSALRKNHMLGGIMARAGYEHKTERGGGLEYYIERGYVPYPLPKRPNRGFHEDGGGQTLENAYQDWTLAQLALAMDKIDDYEIFMTRSRNYRNLYDPEAGWMRPKTLKDEWLEPFDPLKYDDGWVEATAAASTWFVPHDLPGLAELMGGDQALSAKLNRSFELASEHDFVNPSEEERDKYLNYGNQPSMQTAHIFNYVGAPWLTQYWTREVIEKTYSGADPDHGYFGDEDQGLMGALSVLLKTGIFSMKGGCSVEPYYELSGPLFDKITFHLNQEYYPAPSFSLETQNLSLENRYIQSASWRGETWDKAYLMHDDLVEGGTLILNMGSEPKQSWGSEPLPNE